MTEQLRAFLDTDVLTGYYRHDQRVAKLFDDSARDKTRYWISPVVVQELILGLDESRMNDFDLDELENLVSIVSNEDMIAETNKSRDLEFLRSIGAKLHVNDYLNFFAARASDCEFFITSDVKLLGLDRDFNLVNFPPMQIITPDAFLKLEAVA